MIHTPHLFSGEGASTFLFGSITPLPSSPPETVPGALETLSDELKPVEWFRISVNRFSRLVAWTFAAEKLISYRAVNESGEIFSKSAGRSATGWLARKEIRLVFLGTSRNVVQLFCHRELVGTLSGRFKVCELQHQ